jgi:hypothetical protein
MIQAREAVIIRIAYLHQRMSPELPQASGLFLFNLQFLPLKNKVDFCFVYARVTLMNERQTYIINTMEIIEAFKAGAWEWNYSHYKAQVHVDHRLGGFIMEQDRTEKYVACKGRKYYVSSGEAALKQEQEWLSSISSAEIEDALAAKHADDVKTAEAYEAYFTVYSEAYGLHEKAQSMGIGYHAPSFPMTALEYPKPTAYSYECAAERMREYIPVIRDYIAAHTYEPTGEEQASSPVAAPVASFSAPYETRKERKAREKREQFEKQEREFAAAEAVVAAERAAFTSSPVVSSAPATMSSLFSKFGKKK